MRKMSVLICACLVVISTITVISSNGILLEDRNAVILSAILVCVVQINY